MGSPSLSMLLALSPTFYPKRLDTRGTTTKISGAQMEVPSFHSTNQEPQKNRGKNSQQSGILLPLSASLSAASRFSGRYFFLEGRRERESRRRRGRGRRVGERKAVWPRRPEAVGREDSEDSLCLCHWMCYKWQNAAPLLATAFSSTSVSNSV